MQHAPDKALAIVTNCAHVHGRYCRKAACAAGGSKECDAILGLTGPIAGRADLKWLSCQPKAAVVSSSLRLIQFTRQWFRGLKSLTGVAGWCAAASLRTDIFLSVCSMFFLRLRFWVDVRSFIPLGLFHALPPVVLKTTSRAVLNHIAQEMHSSTGRKARTLLILLSATMLAPCATVRDQCVLWLCPSEKDTPAVVSYYACVARWLCKTAGCNRPNAGKRQAEHATNRHREGSL